MKSYVKWTLAHDALFQQMYAEGKSYEEIARAVGRKPGAVRARRLSMNLPIRRHDRAPNKEGRRPRRKVRSPHLIMLNPNGRGHFDSRAALTRLMELWGCA